ncbi:hypothetical protein [Pseudomonas sp. PSE14]|uniref:hypothetical protein n=1 Tax=Pseudomonas TaxID=286 RepID=UPI0023D86D08|nr:hypothetical protein [Pseudomonas sp. PSE14]WEJ74259.1 hypothetical protein O6P39_10425 [Pseudomonas sp. PSE14]
MKDTIITYIDSDGKRAAKSLWNKYSNIASLVPFDNLKWMEDFGGILIIIGHGSTMVKMGRYTGLNNSLGRCGSLFIVLAACEVGEVHQNIGELQSIAQGLANSRKDCIVWGTTRDLPQHAVADGTCFHKSPIFNWLQPANDNFPGMWRQFRKQAEQDEVLSMISNLNLRSV